MQGFGATKNRLTRKCGFVIDQVKRRHAFDQDLQGHRHVLSRQVRSRACFDTASKGEALVLLACEVESIGLIEDSRIPVGGRHGEEDPAVGWNFDTVEGLVRLTRESGKDGDGRFPAEAFLAGRVGKGRIFAEDLPERGIREDGVEKVA